MKKIVFYFIIQSILLISFSYLHFYILDYKELQLIQLSDNLTLNQYNKVKADSNHFEYLNLVSIPLTLLIKTLIISTLLFTVNFFLAKNLKFIDLLVANIKAEFVFLLPILYEIFYFKFVATTHTLTDINNFSALSILNAVGYKNVDSWFIYPLQTLNLFEVAYCFLLVYFLSKPNKISNNDSIKIVSFGYVPAIILWVTLMMFIALNKS